MSNPLHPGGRMPDEATWDDYINAHGGPLTPGWWVTLRWYADSGHPRPEVVGPYSSYAQAISAMEDSLLIDGFATDTNREEWLDDVYVAADPASIARMCADYGPRVTLIDPGDHHHFGPDEPDSGPSRAGGVSARTAVLQAGALNAAPPPASRPGGGSDSIGDGRTITP
ncbi:MAG: hypothetical protein AB7U23_14215 [Dehalococcoidia bacterium]